MKILVLTMGGTIDAQAFPEGQPPPANSTPGSGNLAFRTLQTLEHGAQHIRICNKDSKDLNDQDRAALVDAIAGNGALYERIIVTTGTDRMTDLGIELESRVAPDCPVVLTGAMMPLSNGDISDGAANLHLALTGRPDVQTGIYIAMHGLFLPPAQIRKDFEKRMFVSI